MELLYRPIKKSTSGEAESFYSDSDEAAEEEIVEDWLADVESVRNVIYKWKWR